MRTTNRPFGWWLFLALLFVPVGTIAQNVAQPQEPPPASIETRPDASNDPEIVGRIRSIFGQIPALRQVEISSSAGVVTLTGQVPDAADIGRAEAIASRVAGVVAVENDLTRDLALDSNLSPALGNLGDDLSRLARALPLVGVALLLAVLVALLGYLIAGRSRLWRKLTPNAFLADLVATSIRFIFVLFGIVVALEVLGATALLGVVLGGAGVVGIALGFAVRDTIDNYVSSLMLSLRQPFRANDHVVIEGSEGRVIRLTSRATILMTLDGNHLRIPNSTVFKAVILNYSRNPERRFVFDLGVDADDDPLQAMAVGLEAIHALSFILDRPKATAIIQDVGDSNIVLRFFGWVDQDDADFMKARSMAIQAAKSALEGAGFALPEPIYRLRFDQGAPLPLIGVESGEPAPKCSEPSGKDALSEIADTAPEGYVERRVRNERATESREDLLDDRKPVE